MPDPNAEYLGTAPALAVEIISESNTAETVDRKISIYFEAGTEEIWVVYPKTQRVWKLHSGGGTWHTDPMISRLFPDLELDLRQVFA